MPRKLPKYVIEYADRHGKRRIYLRVPGRPQIALPGPAYSPEFWTAYYAALAERQLQSPGAGADKTKRGTMAALIADYYASSTYTNLAAATKTSYRSLIELLRVKYGDKLVATLTPQIIDAKILKPIVAKSKSQAHTMRKRLVMLLDLAITNGYRKDNPARLAPKIKYKAKGWEPWTEADIAKFRAHWPKGSEERIAFEILLNTGLRRADAVRLGPQHRDGNRHIVHLRKSGETVTVFIPIRPELQEQIAGLGNHLVYITTRNGAGRSDKAFTNYIIEAARAAGLPQHRSPHGLRKAICRRLANGGCTATEISSITGQSIVVIERYIRDFDRETAAVKAMTSYKGTG